jgi:hypothetical protein
MDISTTECPLVELPPIGKVLGGGPRKRRFSTGPSVIPASGSRLEIAEEAS